MSDSEKWENMQETEVLFLIKKLQKQRMTEFAILRSTCCLRENKYYYVISNQTS